jgi:hypothetical protein
MAGGTFRFYRMNTERVWKRAVQPRALPKCRIAGPVLGIFTPMRTSRRGFT